MVESRLVGSSQGWGLFLTSPTSILMTDFCNPSSSKSNRKIIPLHLKGCQTELVSGVAMSSSSPQDEDCMIVVNYTGRLVTIDTPSKEPKGRLLFLPPRVFDYFEHAKVMYSKKDECFHMVSDGGHPLWSLAATESGEPRFHELRFHNLPQFSLSELQLLHSCYRTQQLVESPSGQRFLVKWYAQSPAKTSMPFTDSGGTKRFMVFREEEDMNFCYTEDIGDLCMFLGNNEPFCVKASSFPGLKPNSIYFAGEGYGVYDIATRTPCSFDPKTHFHPSSASNLGLCHWIPPFPL